VIVDKGYDSDAFVERLEARDITPVIPPKANRKEIRDCDFVASVTSLSASSIGSSSTTGGWQRASTSWPTRWPTRFWLASCSPAWSYGSTDDTP